MLTAAFDVDTALESLGASSAGAARCGGERSETGWRGSVPRHWFIATGGPNGGYLAALVARVAGAESGLWPRSLTVHYLAPPKEGAIELRSRIGRAGRTTVFLEIEAEQDGQTVAQALAVCSAWREDAVSFDDTTPPDVAPPDECEPIDPARTPIPDFLRNYDMRIARAKKGSDPFFAWRPVVVGGWMRTPDPRASDHALLAAMTDAWMPPAFLRVKERLLVPTLELTIHFLAPPPEGAHPWVLGLFTSRVAGGGVVEETGELWSESGRLLVQSRQLAVMRRVAT